jgi:hypothetical protein
MTSTGQSAIGRLSDANLPSGEPIEGDSFTTIQTSANVVRSAAGLGVWAPTNDAPPEWMLTINTAGGAGTGYCEVMRLWLLPGVEY